MNVITGKQDIELFEQLIQEDELVVTHLVLKAGKQIPEHFVEQTVVVVPIKGCVLFSDQKNSAEIQPGMIVHLQPSEKHRLAALEDSELMVVKAHLRVK